MTNRAKRSSAVACLWHQLHANRQRGAVTFDGDSSFCNVNVVMRLTRISLAQGRLPFCVVKLRPKR